MVKSLAGSHGHRTLKANWFLLWLCLLPAGGGGTPCRHSSGGGVGAGQEGPEATGASLSGVLSPCTAYQRLPLEMGHLMGTGEATTVQDREGSPLGLQGSP